MFVRGLGVRDIAFLEDIRFKKILSVLVNCCTILSCKQTYYDCLEIDEFWTFVGEKSNKVWLIYAYDRETGNHEVAPKVDCGLGIWKKKCKNSKKIIQNNEAKRHKMVKFGL